MAQLWTTGPALFYLGVGPAQTPLFLGTSANKPTIDVDHQWKGVVNDLAGEVPMDESYQGSQGFIRFALGRWNEAVLQAAKSVPNPAGVGGLNPAGDMGALALTEGTFVPITIVFPAFVKAAYAGGVPGYHFPCCVLESESNPVGTEDRRISMVWRARRAFSPATYTFLLYTHQVGAVPAPN